MSMPSTIHFPGQVGSVELTLMVETKTASRWPGLCPTPFLLHSLNWGTVTRCPKRRLREKEKPEGVC